MMFLDHCPPRRPPRDWRIHVCSLCRLPILPGERRHRNASCGGFVRFTHWRACPGEPPEFGGWLEKALIFLAWAFAGIVYSALIAAVAYQW